MTDRILRLLHVAGIAILTIGALLGVQIPAASAQPCPDVDLVFARGTAEPAGVGGVGQAFVDTLRSQVGARSMDVYPVNYVASSDFSDRIGFARTVVDGIRDAGAHVEATAANCPNTRIVIAGYSQGAVVAGYVTAAVIPDAVPAEFRSFIPNPMPLDVANHVAAVVLFGKPSAQWLSEAGAPPVVIGPLYVPKTIDLCADGDTICNGAPLGGPTIAHAMYPMNGMVNQGAEFAAGKL
jgi:hypothetical protein